MSKQDSAVGSHFGIADFAYDIIARIGPGMLFLCALWPSVVRSQWDDSLWEVFKGIAGLTDWGAGVLFFAVAVFLAYIIGQLMDALVAWWLTEIFAECYYGESRDRDRYPGAIYDWKKAYETCTDLPGVDMKGVIRKAQIESHALANLGVLLILLMVVFLIAHGLAALGPGWMIVAMPLLAIGLFMASAYRQRYRVWLVCLNMKIEFPVPPEEKASVKKWILLRIWGCVWGYVNRWRKSIWLWSRVCRKRIRLIPCILLVLLPIAFGNALGKSIRAAEKASTSTSEVSIVASPTPDDTADPQGSGDQAPVDE